MNQQIAWFDTDKTGEITGFGTATTDEIYALREAVEVLENMPHVEESELKFWLECFADMATRFDEFTNAAREAVEVLEDMYEQREAEAERWFQKWIGADSDYHETKAALRNAEAERDNIALSRANERSLARKVAETMLEHAKSRKLGVAAGLLHEEDPDFWVRWALGE